MEKYFEQSTRRLDKFNSTTASSQNKIKGKPRYVFKIIKPSNFLLSGISGKFRYFFPIKL